MSRKFERGDCYIRKSTGQKYRLLAVSFKSNGKRVVTLQPEDPAKNPMYVFHHFERDFVLDEASKDKPWTTTIGNIGDEFRYSVGSAGSSGTQDSILQMVARANEGFKAITELNKYLSENRNVDVSVRIGDTPKPYDYRRAGLMSKFRIPRTLKYEPRKKNFNEFDMDGRYHVHLKKGNEVHIGCMWFMAHDLKACLVNMVQNNTPNAKIQCMNFGVNAPIVIATKEGILFDKYEVTWAAAEKLLKEMVAYGF